MNIRLHFGVIAKAGRKLCWIAAYIGRRDFPKAAAKVIIFVVLIMAGALMALAEFARFPAKVRKPYRWKLVSAVD
jgi:hypothetical protein